MTFQILRRASLAAALGLASLSPLQTGLATLGLTLVAGGPAMAQTAIPGVGVVVKKKPGNAPIAEGKSDDEGQFSFEGLERGEYSVCLSDGTGCADAKVGKNGTIRGMTVFDEKLKETTKDYVGHVTLLR